MLYDLMYLQANGIGQMKLLPKSTPHITNFLLTNTSNEPRHFSGATNPTKEEVAYHMNVTLTNVRMAPEITSID